MIISDDIKEGLALFEAHYRARFGSIQSETEETDAGRTYGYRLISDHLRMGNNPKIFHYGVKTNDVIVLTHGLSDSPHYVEAIGRRFIDKPKANPRFQWMMDDAIRFSKESVPKGFYG
jgi:hypothetical protein